MLTDVVAAYRRPVRLKPGTTVEHGGFPATSTRRQRAGWWTPAVRILQPTARPRPGRAHPRAASLRSTTQFTPLLSDGRWFMRTVWTFVFLIATAAGSACRGVPGAIEPPAASAADDSCQVATAAVADGPLSKEIATLQTRAAGSPGAEAALEQLGYTFVARARLRTTKASTTRRCDAASCLERRSPSNHQARLLRGHVLHQQHGSARRKRLPGTSSPRVAPRSTCAARRRADGAGTVDGGRRGLPAHDRPEAVLPVVRPRGASSLARGSSTAPST